MLPRPGKDYPVGGRSIADRAPVPGLHASTFQRVDPAGRQIHVDENPQRELTAISCSSLRHAA